MSDIIELEKAFQHIKGNEDFLDYIFEFKEILLSSDSQDFLNFHYISMNDDSLPSGLRSMIQSFFWSEIENQRDINKVSEFLYDMYNKETEVSKKSNVMQILGHLRSSHAKLLAYENISSSNYDLRYKSIIVLGWIGDESDLEILNNSLRHDVDGELRGYSATAMRQIWYNHDTTTKKIIHFLNEAIIQEDNENALIGIIVTAQDLLKKKLGLKESSYGDISGDVQKAKIKTIEALKNVG